MFEDIREQYRMTGAGEEFFRCLREPEEAFEPYLDDGYLRKVNMEWLSLEDPAFDALTDAARRMLEHPELVRLASSIRQLIFDGTLSVDYLVHIGFPRPDSGDRGMDAFFGLLVHLSGIDVVQRRYEERGIPLTVMRDSYRSVRVWVNSFRSFFGYYGHNRECPRMLYIENFRFIRLGRLEFEPRPFYGQAVVLRERRSSRLRLLAAGGVVFREDGRIDGTNDVFDPHSRVACYEETVDAVSGNEIVGGRIRGETVRISKEDWEVVLRPGDPCINSHIPRDGRLLKEDAEKSFAEAETFFRTYFPEIRFRFFQCHSWLLDDVYEDMLGPESNIVRFQSLFTRFPVKSGDRGAMISVFTEAEFQLSEWKATSTLQRKIIEHYAAGGKVCHVGGIRPVMQGDPPLGAPRQVLWNRKGRKAMTKEELFETMRGTVIVSCQATPGEPLYMEDDSIMYLMARAAKQAGAKMIRTSSARDIAAVRKETGLPVIGLIKREYPGYTGRITLTMREVDECVEAGADIVSIDCTFTDRADGLTPAQYLKQVKEKYPGIIIMADCATYEEAVSAYRAGADLVGTTMHGYTPQTKAEANGEPNFALVERLSRDLPCPVIAEGRVHTPEQARRMLEIGAWAVVVGGAITRPLEIAGRFMDAVKDYRK